MAKFQGRYRIESARLPGWDYRTPGWYFVTICTQDRIPFLGRIVDGNVVLSPTGLIVAEEWQLTPQGRPNVVLDEWGIMPNHLPHPRQCRPAAHPDLHRQQSEELDRRPVLPNGLDHQKQGNKLPLTPGG